MRRGRVSEAAAVKRKTKDGAFVDHGGKAERLGFYGFGFGADDDGLVGPGQGHLECMSVTPPRAAVD
jgi:hypothetical protein